MNRCPSCGMPLPDSQEYCPRTSTMTDEKVGGNGMDTIRAYSFAGCAVVRFESLTKETKLRSGPRTRRGSSRPTDGQRAIAAWGKDCIISEFGPLPTERELKGQFVDHSAWAE